jgi:hypothetical protein
MKQVSNLANYTGSSFASLINTITEVAKGSNEQDADCFKGKEDAASPAAAGSTSIWDQFNGRADDAMTDNATEAEDTAMSFEQAMAEGIAAATTEALSQQSMAKYSILMEDIPSRMNRATISFLDANTPGAHAVPKHGTGKEKPLTIYVTTPDATHIDTIYNWQKANTATLGEAKFLFCAMTPHWTACEKDAAMEVVLQLPPYLHRYAVDDICAESAMHMMQMGLVHGVTRYLKNLGGPEGPCSHLPDSATGQLMAANILPRALKMPMAGRMTGSTSSSGKIAVLINRPTPQALIGSEPDTAALRTWIHTTRSLAGPSPSVTVGSGNSAFKLDLKFNSVNFSEGNQFDYIELTPNMAEDFIKHKWCRQDFLYYFDDKDKYEACAKKGCNFAHAVNGEYENLVTRLEELTTYINAIQDPTLVPVGVDCWHWHTVANANTCPREARSLPRGGE